MIQHREAVIASPGRLRDMPDVVIVGGGIIGAACAFELATRGASVTLVERDHLAAHASGRNQGLWVLPGEEANIPMAEASLAAYLELAQGAPIDIALDPEPVGLVLVAGNAADLDVARSEVALARRHGIAVDDLETPHAIRDVEPALSPNLAGAWLVHHGHRFDPGALTVALALAAKDRGATVRHHLNARALSIRGDRIDGVVTDEGALTADSTVVAAGPWSDALLEPAGVRLPIVGARGWLVRVRPPLDLLQHLIEAPGPHAALRGPSSRRSTAEEVARDGVPGSAVGTIVHPARDGTTALIGSSRQTWLTPEPPDAEVVAMLLRAAIEIVPGLADAEVLSSWWGIRPLSPDERPFVGAVREGLYVATGHGSEGVILGAGTAQLVAAQLAGGTPPFDPAPFDPLRFDGSDRPDTTRVG
jgi:D-hydroxyproline dehydrogenase subunit beta